MIAIRLSIRGRVQGVWYRDWTVREAGELGVAGWVRNCPDGTVEAWLEGDEVQVRQLIDHMREGPPAARVDSIEESPQQAEGLSGFRRR